MTWEAPPKAAPKKTTAKNVPPVLSSVATLTSPEVLGDPNSENSIAYVVVEVVDLEKFANETLHTRISLLAFAASTSGNPDLARELNAVDILLSETKQALVRAIKVAPSKLADELQSLANTVG